MHAKAIGGTITPTLKPVRTSQALQWKPAQFNVYSKASRFVSVNEECEALFHDSKKVLGLFFLVNGLHVLPIFCWFSLGSTIVKTSVFGSLKTYLKVLVVHLRYVSARWLTGDGGWETGYTTGPPKSSRIGSGFHASLKRTSAIVNAWPCVMCVMSNPVFGCFDISYLIWLLRAIFETAGYKPQPHLSLIWEAVCHQGSARGKTDKTRKKSLQNFNSMPFRNQSTNE